MIKNKSYEAIGGISQIKSIKKAIKLINQIVDLEIDWATNDMFESMN